VTMHDSKSNGAEAYRTLRTNLLFSGAVSGVKRVVVSSASPREGKSTTISNLAVAMAQQGNKVLLIDCDLRRPRQHKIFDMPAEPGVTNVLMTPKSYQAAIRETFVENLSIMTSGPTPPNPAELLSSPQMTELLDNLSMVFDILLIDSPPLLAAADAAVLTRLADGAIVVVRAGQTQRHALESAFQQLTQVGARIIGTVLNDPSGEVPKYAAYYGYYYNNYYDYSETKA